MKIRWHIAVVVVLSLICGALGLSLIDHPFRAVGAPFLYGTDFATVQHFLESGRMFWESSGRLVGYHPWFAAGYPYADYTSGVGWKLMGVIFWSLNTGTIATIFLVGPLMLFPLAGYVVLKLPGRSSAEALTGSFLAACLVLFGPPLYVAWMGLGEFAAAVALVMAASGCMIRWNRHGGGFNWVALLATLILAFMAHKTALPTLFIVGVAVVLFGRFGVYRIAMSALAGLVAFIANLFWILPLWRMRQYLDFVPHYHWGEKEATFFGDFFRLWGPLGSLPLAWALLIGSVIGWRILRRRERPTANTWFGAQVLLAVFAYIGPHIDFLAPMQPRRFVSYFFALSIFPTSVACYGALRSLGTRAGAAAVIISIALLSLLPNAYRRVAPHKVMTSLPERAQAVTDWISKNTTRDARVLVEEISDAGRPDNPYQGGYLNALLPTITGREIIGGPYPGVDILHHRVTLLEGILLGRPVAGLSDAELARLFDLYNIGWVVCFSDGAKSRFLKTDDILEKTAEFGPVYCFNVKGEKSFISGGKGEVHARANAIEVKITRIEGKSVVIKYHWTPDLEATGGVRIERFDIDEDPVGLIRAFIEAPTEFAIVNKY